MRTLKLPASRAEPSSLHGHWRSVLAMLILTVLLFAPPLRATTLAPLDLEQTVAQADAIVVGTVVSSESRWGNVAKRWIETDYVVAVEDVIQPSASGARTAGEVRITYWGGTVDGESQAVADMRLPNVGERLVVMLAPGWSNKSAGFSPVVGMNYGLFGVVAGTAARKPTVVDFDGQPLVRSATGRLQLHGERGADLGSPGVALDEFTAWLRANAARIRAMPPPQRSNYDPNDPRILKTFALQPETGAAIALRTRESTRVPDAHAGPRDDPAVPSAVAYGQAHAQEIAQTRRSAPGTDGTIDYVPIGKKPALPIVVNNFPDSFTPWSPEDEYQMSKWNFYAGNTFRVFTTPTGTFGWQNDRFDLAGWPSSATMQSVYGSPWGSNTVGIAIYRWNASNVMIECDIAFNPAFGFTLDDEWVYNGASAQGFRQVMVHELGHMLGLSHNFNFLAEMNYFPSVFRFFGLPFMDDAQGLRALHPGNVTARTDLAVYLFRGTGFQSVTDATYPASVAAGGLLTVDDYHIENVGTTTIGTPTIQWYLTSARNFVSSYYYLGTSTHSSLAPFTYFTPSSVGRTFTVPGNVPPGNYYLGAYIPGEVRNGQGGFPFANDFAFSRFRISVTTTPPSAPTIGTAVAGNGSASVAFTPGSLGTGTLVNHTANCGIVTKTGTSSPIVVTGLTNGLTYTCRVRTTTTHGTSAWSGLSNPVTPTAPGSSNAKRFDFNGDGKSDIFWDNGSGGRWAYFMNGAVVASMQPMPSAAAGWQVVQFGDFNGDGKVDLLWRNGAAPTQHWIYLMNGNAAIGGGPVNVAAGYSAKFVADFNGDGKSDILWENAAGSRWAYYMNGAAVASNVPMPATAPGWGLVAVGDFNGDGKSDMLFRNAAAPTSHWVYLLNGNVVIGGGGFGVAAGYSLTGAADFDGNGKSDLLWSNAAGARWVYFMNGAAVGSSSAFPSAAPGWTLAGVADFNGDGKSDVLWRNGANPAQHWIYLMNGSAIAGGGGVGVASGYAAVMPW